MKNITWKKTENYEWTGTDEKKNYTLLVIEPNAGSVNRWYWIAFRDEDRILHSMFEDEPHFADPEIAKQAAEQALDNYLKEQDNYVNLLHEVVKQKS